MKGKGKKKVFIRYVDCSLRDTKNIIRKDLALKEKLYSDDIKIRITVEEIL